MKKYFTKSYIFPTIIILQSLLIGYQSYDKISEAKSYKKKYKEAALIGCEVGIDKTLDTLQSIMTKVQKDTPAKVLIESPKDTAYYVLSRKTLLK